MSRAVITATATGVVIEFHDRNDAHVATTTLPTADVDKFVAALWPHLSDRQRLELRTSCCSGCGTLERCQCWNDE